MTHSLKRLKNRIRPRWIKTFRRLVSSRLKLARVTKRLGLRPISGNPLRDLKRSDTLFILGSGGSINQLSPEEWATIRAADSAGFNFWPIHDHVPTLYVTEICNLKGGEERNYQAYCELMRVRADDYTATPILIKDGERVDSRWLSEYIQNFPASLRRNIALSWDWETPDEDEAGLSGTLRRWARWGLLSSHLAPLLKKRASIFYLVLLGLRAGYRKIVLCGVDLDNNDYFYRAREAEYAAKGRPVPQPVQPGTAIHKTDNPSLGAMTISRAIEALNREILIPHGVELSVALQSSRLHPMLPAYFPRPDRKLPS